MQPSQIEQDQEGQQNQQGHPFNGNGHGQGDFSNTGRGGWAGRKHRPKNKRASFNNRFGGGRQSYNRGGNAYGVHHSQGPQYPHGNNNNLNVNGSGNSNDNGILHPGAAPFFPVNTVPPPPIDLGQTAFDPSSVPLVPRSYAPPKGPVQDPAQGPASASSFNQFNPGYYPTEPGFAPTPTPYVPVQVPVQGLVPDPASGKVHSPFSFITAPLITITVQDPQLIVGATPATVISPSPRPVAIRTTLLSAVDKPTSQTAPSTPQSSLQTPARSSTSFVTNPFTPYGDFPSPHHLSYNSLANAFLALSQVRIINCSETLHKKVMASHNEVAAQNAARSERLESLNKAFLAAQAKETVHDKEAVLLHEQATTLFEQTLKVGSEEQNGGNAEMKQQLMKDTLFKMQGAVAHQKERRKWKVRADHFMNEIQEVKMQEFRALCSVYEGFIVSIRNTLEETVGRSGEMYGGNEGANGVKINGEKQAKDEKDTKIEKEIKDEKDIKDEKVNGHKNNKENGAELDKSSNVKAVEVNKESKDKKD